MVLWQFHPAFVVATGGAGDGAECPGAWEWLSALVSSDGAGSIAAAMGDGDFRAEGDNGAICHEILTGQAHLFCDFITMNWHRWFGFV